jgi:nitrate reductase gamma subunit
MFDFLHHFTFGIFPYVALTVFAVGSLIRFDREQYSWRSGSSQLLRKRQLVIGSVLFHVGILLLFMGHFVGLLTPHTVYEALGVSVATKQMLAIIAGSIFGLTCFAGLTILLHRRLFDPRIRGTSAPMDIFILCLLWVQLSLGLATIPFSIQHADGSVMLLLSEWAQRIVTFRSGASELVADVGIFYKVHIIMGLIVFMVFPFSRLVHIWSAPIWYIGRPGYQIVRTRRPTSGVRKPAP